MCDVNDEQMASMGEQAYIHTPLSTGDPVKSLNDFLGVSGAWHGKNHRKNRGMLSDLWYRGVNQHYPHQAPGVYRRTFNERAKHLQVRGGLEHKRLY
jgi:hypothetical protein